LWSKPSSHPAPELPARQPESACREAPGTGVLGHESRVDLSTIGVLSEDPRELFAGMENARLPVSGPELLCPEDSVPLSRPEGWRAQFNGPPVFQGEALMCSRCNEFYVLVGGTVVKVDEYWKPTNQY